MAVNDGFRETELLRDSARFVFEQVSQRLDYLQPHILGQAADVVVRLDVGGSLRSAFDNVRIQRSLSEELRSRNGLRVLFEDPDELLADDLALSLRIGHASKARQKSLAGVDGNEPDA